MLSFKRPSLPLLFDCAAAQSQAPGRPSTPPAAATQLRPWLWLATAALCGLLAACASSPPQPGSPQGTTIVPQANSPRPGAALQPLTSTSLQGEDVVALSPPSDLWSRMRQGFAMPDLNNELVQRHTQFYAERPEYFARMTERSNKYLFHIIEELERRGMPTELALLPFVESAFNPQAISSAKAAGMWQFVPSTGRHFELTQNAFRDDRRDVLASTRAALDYLSRLHNMFGNWHLALAAYNWGEGSVQRAQNRNQRLGLGLGYSDLTMPAETRNYVPKLQALKNIVAQPERYGVELPLIENHPYFQTVDIVRDIDVALAAQLAEVSLEDFKSLNPSANKPLIMAAGTPQILLPWNNAITFAKNLQQYAGPLASWTVWTAPSTMSAAQAAQQVGMSEAALRAANNIPARMRIRAGSSLLVARSGQMTDVSSQLADSGRIAFAPEPVAVARAKRYTVRRGDTLSSVASRHGLSSATLARWNKLKPNAMLRIGQTLNLTAPAAVTQGQRSRPAQASSKRQGKSQSKTSTSKKSRSQR
jgi:membrane-bound lytic murein transglycosylase D